MYVCTIIVHHHYLRLPGFDLWNKLPKNEKKKGATLHD